MKILKLLYQTLWRFIEDGCSGYAAALTYVTLLALVPFSIVFISILSLFTPLKAYIAPIQEFILKNFVASSAEAIQHYLLRFIEQGAHLSTLSIIALLIIVVLVALNIVSIFDRIWRVKTRPHSSITAVKYFFIIILFPIITVLLLIVSNYFFSIPYVSYIGFLFPHITVFIFFTALYIFIPNRKVHFTSAAISGFIAMLLFVAAKNGFSLYIAHFTNYKALYGLFYIIPVFLAWIYLCWQIILFGVEINYTIEKNYCE